MLIIFDLDDTLIDTTGSITPIKLEQALSKMVEAGLQIGDFQEALAILKRLDTAAESASQTLLEFLEIINADKKFYQIGHAEVYGPLPQDFPVYPVEHAIDLLSDLSLEHQLALVSMGSPAQQRLKLKNAGIDSTIFSKICISEDRDKKPHYKTILDELGFAPSQTLVCGDRVKRDLSPAKELGCITVQMQWGRGLSSLLSALPHYIARDVDHVIKKLSEIKDILNSYDKQ
ncbi:MAG TPA: HAD family hydrolase [Rhabdochlamydiaceae bacterium]|nr:HAD family hydrolase [Rhabdochlamydiaceae bacterium]